MLQDLIAHTPAGERIRIVGNSFSYVPGEGLGEDTGAFSWVRLAPGGVHQKVWSSTRSGRSRDVVLTGSMNLTYYSAGQYTDMYAWADRRDVRRALDRRVTQLVRRLPAPPPLGPLDLGAERLWFYPGYDRGSDPVRAQLAAVPAQGARIRVVL